MQELTDLIVQHPFLTTGATLAAARLFREMQIRTNLGLESYSINQRGKEYPSSVQLVSGSPQNVFAIVTIDDESSDSSEIFEETLLPGHVYVLNATGKRRHPLPPWKKTTCEAKFYKGSLQTLKEVSEEIASRLENPYDVVIVDTHTHSNKMIARKGRKALAWSGIPYFTERYHVGPITFGVGNGDVYLDEFLAATEALEKAQVVHFYETCFGGDHAKKTALRKNRTAIAPNAPDKTLRFTNSGSGPNLIMSLFTTKVLEGYLHGLSLGDSFLQGLGKAERSLDFYMGILPFYNRHTPVLYYNNWRPEENRVGI